jgi:hypothetical protein
MSLKERRFLESRFSEWVQRIGYTCDGHFGKGVITGINVTKDGMKVLVESPWGVLPLSEDEIENAPVRAVGEG